MRYTRKFRGITVGGTLFLAVMACSALAEDSIGTHYTAFGGGVITSYDAADYDLLPPSETFNFNSGDRFYQKHKFSDDLRIKGVEVSEGVYFGEARVAGNRGPGFVVEKGDLYWGVNHRGAEVLFRF